MPKNTFKTNNEMKNKLQELINRLVREEFSLMEKKKKDEEEINYPEETEEPTPDEASFWKHDPPDKRISELLHKRKTRIRKRARRMGQTRSREMRKMQRY